MAQDDKKSFVAYLSWFDALEEYSDAEVGQLMRALARYAKTGEEPEFSDRGMRGLWRSMKDGVDKDFSKYREKSQKSSEAAKARWEKQTQKDDVSDVQTDANALREMRTHTAASECMHSHPTNTDTSTDTATVTPEVPAAAADSRTDSDLAEIVQHFQDVIGDFPRSALDKLQKWRQEYSTEMILLAIDKAAEAGKRSWNYINGILSGWRRDGIRTPGDVAANEQRRQEQPRGKQATESTAEAYANIFKWVVKP